jgi:hypothetical protein
MEVTGLFCPQVPDTAGTVRLDRLILLILTRMMLYLFIQDWEFESFGQSYTYS